jgi:hypothetical protein
VPTSRVFGRAEWRAKTTCVNEHGAARLRYESDPRTKRNQKKRVARARSLRWETTEYECSSWNGFGVQKSIGRIAGRDARGRYQAHLGYVRPSLEESATTR